MKILCENVRAKKQREKEKPIEAINGRQHRQFAECNSLYTHSHTQTHPHTYIIGSDNKMRVTTTKGRLEKVKESSHPAGVEPV